MELGDGLRIEGGGGDTTGLIPSTRQINTTAPLSGGGDLSANRTLAVAKATAAVDGYLAATDFITFSAKVSSARTISTTSPLSGGGDLSANRTIGIAQAATASDGYLIYQDWNEFRAKAPASHSHAEGDVTGLVGDLAAKANALSGTSGKIAKFTSASTIGDSVITELLGKIGIGITPDAPLHVGYTDAIGDPGFKVENLGAAAGNVHLISHRVTAGNSGLFRFKYYDDGTTLVEAATVAGLIESIVAATRAGAIVFSTQSVGGASATEKMRLTSSGFLGIGVTPATKLDIGAGAMQFAEMAAPSAGPADTARLFSRDDGSGTTQLCVIFSTGAIQVLASVNQFRVQLAAARTYYVRTDGNDANTGLVDSAGGAFLTLQAAVNAYQALDCNGFDVTIQVGDGTYAGGATISYRFGAGNLNFWGNKTTPANCVISLASGVPIWVTGHPPGSVVDLQGFKLVNVGNFELYVERGSIVNFNNMEFGACALAQIFSAGGGQISGISSTYKISGAAPSHLYSYMLGYICITGSTVTITGTPAFSVAFARCIWGYVYWGSMSVTGSATGSRYSATKTGIVDTNGGGATYLPGDSGGSVASQGQYI